jgi:hypothetical protein
LFNVKRLEPCPAGRKELLWWTVVGTQLLSENYIIVILLLYRFLLFYKVTWKLITVFFIFIRFSFIQMFGVRRSVVVFLFILFISSTNSMAKQTNPDCIINELKIPENLLYNGKALNTFFEGKSSSIFK